MKHLLLAGCFMLPSAASAQKQPCFKTAVSEASGLILTVQSGWMFQVFPGEGMRTAAWLPLDGLTICPIGGDAYSIINTSRRGAGIKALREF